MQVISIESIKRVIPLGCVFCLLTCSCTNEEQVLRTETRRFVSNTISNGIHSRNAVIGSGFVLHVMGPPDSILSVDEFLRLFDNNKAYQKYQQEELRFYYVKGISAVNEFLKDIAVAKGLRAPELADDMSTCRLWMYDESKHYPRPLRHGLFHDHGFYCAWFTVQEGVVLDVGGAIGWTREGPNLTAN